MLLIVQLAGLAEEGQHGGRPTPPPRLVQPPLQLLDQQVQPLLLQAVQAGGKRRSTAGGTGVRARGGGNMGCAW